MVQWKARNVSTWKSDVDNGVDLRDGEMKQEIETTVLWIGVYGNVAVTGHRKAVKARKIGGEIRETGANEERVKSIVSGRARSASNSRVGVCTVYGSRQALVSGTVQ